MDIIDIILTVIFAVIVICIGIKTVKMVNQLVNEILEIIRKNNKN